MDTAGQILKEKGSTVYTIPPTATVFQAVETMAEKRIGALLVCEENAPCGIFTERDLMNQVILAKRDPATTTVGEAMSKEVVCIEPRTTMAEAMAIMTERRCRHLPVVEEANIVGLVSIGDLVRWESRNHSFHVRMLTDYICGKYPG
jgi:CBS domain-containing protein